MRNSFLPGTDSGLLAWARNFSTIINQTPALFGILPEQAADFASLFANYAAAMANVEPGIRSKSTVSLKNTARSALKISAQLLASIVRGQATVSDAQKIELNLTVRSAPTRQPAPEDAPDMDILSVTGRSVRLRMHAKGRPDMRGRPPAVDGALIFTFVGEQPPENLSLWNFAKITNRTILNLALPTTAEPGAQVWIIARWFNRRKEMGPPSSPACTNVQFGGPMRMAA